MQQATSRFRPPALLVAAAVCLATVGHVRAAFVEDFSGFANDAASNQLDGDAQTNGWTFVNPQRFQVVNGILYNNTGGGTLSQKTGGKTHGLDVANHTRVDITFRAGVARTVDGVTSQAQFWLADEQQNGYGVTLARDAQNSVVVTKFTGGDNPFGAVRNADAADSDSAPYVSAASGSDSIHTIHLAIEQDGPGGDVKVTVWSAAVAGSDYESPVLQIVDTGAGGAFGGPVFDLASLTHAGLALSRYYSSGGVARIDDIEIDVSNPVIPEPGSMGLLGLGGAIALCRGRTR